jgi:hypothetical protein
MISPPNQHHPYQLKPTNNKRYQPSLQVPMSPPSPKLIVEQPLTAFLYHQRGPPPQTRRDLR